MLRRSANTDDLSHVSRANADHGRLGRLSQRRDQSGAASVEFALILVPFLTLIFGMIQYGLYFYAAQTGSHAANTAIRQLSVGKCTDSTELLALVNDELGASAKSGTTTVATTYKMSDGSTAADADAADVGGKVKLTIKFHTVNMEFPFLPFLDTAEVSREVDARIEFVPQAGCPL